MPSLNKIILVGRLTRDPEQSYTSSNLSVVKFSIAVDRQYKDSQTGEKKTDFFDCRAFRQTADFVSQYITKGQLVAVEGRVEINKVAGQDGNSRYFTNVVCDRVESLQGRDSAEGGGEFGGGGGGYNNAAPAARNGGGSGSGSSGGGRGAQSDDDGYFDDEEPAPRQPARQQAAAPRSEAAAPRAATPKPAAPRPAAKPAAAYPAADDDFDDSDPFADE